MRRYTVVEPFRCHSSGSGVRGFAVLVGLAIAYPAAAQDAGRLQRFREQYDTVMSNFERIAEASGNAAAKARAGQGIEAMQGLSDDDLAKVYSRTRVPDLSVVVEATGYAASKATAAAADRAAAPVPSSPGLPGPGPIQSQCSSVDYTPGTRFVLLVAKEVTNSILAAAAWVCNEDILGENGSSTSTTTSTAPSPRSSTTAMRTPARSSATTM